MSGVSIDSFTVMGDTVYFAHRGSAIDVADGKVWSVPVDAVETSSVELRIVNPWMTELSR